VAGKGCSYPICGIYVRAKVQRVLTSGDLPSFFFTFFLISCLRVPACLKPIIRPLAKGLKRANEVLAIEGNWEASEAGNKSVQECSCVALDRKTATEKTNTYETYIHVYITGLHGQYLTSDFLAHCILSTAPPPHTPRLNVEPVLFLLVRLARRILMATLNLGGQGGGSENENLKLSIDQGWPQGKLDQGPAPKHCRVFLENCSGVKY
jgi:hypothetical protein